MRDAHAGSIIGYRRDGRPIRLIAGGAEDEDTSEPTEPTGDDSTGEPEGKDGQDGDAGSTVDAGAEPTFTAADMKKVRDEAAGYRNQRKTAEQERDQMKSIVDTLKQALDPDAAEEEPAKVAERAQKERDDKDAELRALRIERAVEKMARKHEADPDALTDSRSFTRRTADLDPSADTFTSELDALVKETVDANPKLRVAQAATRSGSEFTGGSGGTSNTQLPAEGDTAAWRKYLRGEK